MDLYHILQLTSEDQKVRHKWYDRTVKLADMYFRFVTGVKIGELLERFVRRESEEEFLQRQLITQQITPAWSNKINKGFLKTHRADGINRVIKFPDEQKANREKLDGLILKYRADKPLKSYLIKAFDRYNMVDPNAFLVNSFEESTDQSQPNQPVAIEFISQNVLNYQYKNDILQWIVLRDFIKVDLGTEIKTIARYQLLAPDIKIVMTPVPNDSAGRTTIDKKITEETQFFTVNSQLYQLETVSTGLELIPAMPFGYKEDLATNGDTFVSIWHEALPFYWKSLKTVSELDLTMALSAFPLRSQYVGACLGVDCHDGVLGNGDTCDVCNGSGNQPIQTSAQEVLTLQMPKDLKELIDIGKLSHFDAPDQGIIKIQIDYIESLEEDAIGAIFNSDIFSKNTTVQTATEVSSKKDNINDPLLGYAEGFSSMWKFVVRSVATQAGISIKDLTLTYEFPKDFRFETLEELITTFQNAVKANAPGDVKGAIARRLAAKAFVDDPIGLAEFEAKQKLNPFANENAESVLRKIAIGVVLPITEFIWANFDDLIDQIVTQDDTFFTKSIDKQKEILLAKAQELDTRTAAPMNIPEG